MGTLVEKIVQRPVEQIIQVPKEIIEQIVQVPKIEVVEEIVQVARVETRRRSCRGRSSRSSRSR
jgi:hypothetical protein